jgi:hypothetical protein
MFQIAVIIVVTIASAAAVTAVLGAGFAQLVKREQSFTNSKKEATQKHSHDDATTRHPTVVS